MSEQAINKTVLHYLNNSYLHTEYVDVIIPSCIEKFLVLQSGHKILYTNLPEAAALDPYLKKLKPKTVLDLACGIGRGSVYLCKRYQWNDTKFILYDGDSGDETLAGIDKNEKI